MREEVNQLNFLSTHNTYHTTTKKASMMSERRAVHEWWWRWPLSCFIHPTTNTFLPQYICTTARGGYVLTFSRRQCHMLQFWDHGDKDSGETVLIRRGVVFTAKKNKASTMRFEFQRWCGRVMNSVCCFALSAAGLHFISLLVLQPPSKQPKHFHEYSFPSLTQYHLLIIS